VWRRYLFRVQTESDLVSAEAKHYHDCALRFRAGRQINEQSEKGRPPHKSRNIRETLSISEE